MTSNTKTEAGASLSEAAKQCDLIGQAIYMGKTKEAYRMLDELRQLLATPQADAAIAAGGAQEAECTCSAKDMPFGRCCKAPPILAADHRGMRVDYSGMFKQAISALKHGAKEPGIAEMLRQLKDHMTELGQRWYAGDAAVVDELLQLYCVERDARTALSAPAASNGAPK